MIYMGFILYYRPYTNGGCRKRAVISVYFRVPRPRLDQSELTICLVNDKIEAGIMADQLISRFCQQKIPGRFLPKLHNELL